MEYIMSTNLAESQIITPEEYLAGEAVADEKHEYLNGSVYALHDIRNMAGAGDSHVKISLNIAALIKNHLRGSRCSTYISDMRVKVDSKDKAWFYPDVMVSCDPNDRQHETIKHKPVLVIEVMSKSTRDYDRGGKFAVYRQLSSLKEYVLVEPRHHYVEVFRLNKRNRWELFTYEGTEATIEFSSIDLQCSIADFYEDVLNLDV